MRSSARTGAQSGVRRGGWARGWRGQCKATVVIHQRDQSKDGDNVVLSSSRASLATSGVCVHVSSELSLCYPLIETMTVARRVFVASSHVIKVTSRCSKTCSKRSAHALN